MKARGLVPIIFILSTFTLFSQVKIKEKVEIKPGKDTCALRYPWTGYDYTYIGITVESTILSNDGYFILNGGSEYPIKLKLVHDYIDPETLEPIHEESDFQQSQLFSTSVHIYEDTVGNTAFISGEDTCMCLNGIPQGFKLYAGNELYKDTNNFVINIQTEDGAYSGGVGIRILKSQLITTLVPAELSAGDTVSIFIKRKNMDGTIKEFLPEQKFEAGILEGCDYGKFIWEGLKETVHIRDTVYTNDSVYVKDSTYIKDKDSVYVKDVKQPIKFIVANTFDTTISIVKLRIGVKRKYCFDESTLLKSSGQNRQTIESNYCTLVGFEYGDYATLDETIIKKDCEKLLPECDNPIILPTLDYNLNPPFTKACIGNQKDIFGNITKIQSGGFIAMEWDNYQGVYSLPCYNKNDGLIHFNFNLKELIEDHENFTSVLKPKIVLSICYGQIIEAKKTIIYNDEDLLNILRNKPDKESLLNEISIFKHDLESLRHYDGSNIKYFFDLEIKAHENKHKSLYDSVLISKKIDLLDNKIKDFKINCEEYIKNKELGVRPWDNKIQGFIKDYINKSIKDYATISEERVQTSAEVYKVINDYEKLLDDFSTGKIH